MAKRNEKQSLAGLVERHRRRGRGRLMLSLCAALAGGLMLLVPSPPAAFLLLAAAFLLLPEGLAERRGAREAGLLEEAWQQEGAEDEIALTLPARKLFIWRGLLIAEHRGLHVCELERLSRVYLEFVDRRFGRLAWLRCEYRGGNVDSMPLVSRGRKRHINDSLQPLWSHMAANYPDCELGYTYTMRKAEGADNERN